MKFWCILADTLPKSTPFLYSINSLLSNVVQSVTGHAEEKKEIYVYKYVQKSTFLCHFTFKFKHSACLFVSSHVCLFLIFMKSCCGLKEGSSVMAEFSFEM